MYDERSKNLLCLLKFTAFSLAGVALTGAAFFSFTTLAFGATAPSTTVVAVCLLFIFVFIFFVVFWRYRRKKRPSGWSTRSESVPFH